LRGALFRALLSLNRSVAQREINERKMEIKENDEAM